MAFCFRMVVKTAENYGPFPLSAEHYEHLLNFRFDNKNHLKKGIIGLDMNCRIITVIHSRSALHLFLNVYFGLYFWVGSVSKQSKMAGERPSEHGKRQKQFSKTRFFNPSIFWDLLSKAGQSRRKKNTASDDIKKSSHTTNCVEKIQLFEQFPVFESLSDKMAQDGLQKAAENEIFSKKLMSCVFVYHFRFHTSRKV